MPIIKLQKDRASKTICFVHIPKTGGTSVVEFFRSLGATSYLDNQGNGHRPPLRCPPQHFHYQTLDAIVDLSKSDFSFAIVRHPVYRMLSNFFWAHRNVPSNKTLPDFTLWLKHVFNEYTKDEYFLDNHIRPQNEFVGPNLRRVYKLESGLSAILDDVLKSCGITTKRNNHLSAPQTNTSSPDRKKEYLMGLVTNDTLNLIHEFYKSDYYLFNYKKSI